MIEPLKLVESEPITAVSEYRRYFPDFFPSCFQQDLIEQTVTDLNIWREALIFWKGNDYRAKSVKTLLDYYDEKVAGKQNGSKKFNTSRKRSENNSESTDDYLKRIGANPAR